eukprot:881361-Pyramimonas_sp.AAC.1
MCFSRAAPPDESNAQGGVNICVGALASARWRGGRTGKTYGIHAAGASPVGLPRRGWWVYDSRNLLSKRAYLQVLLGIDRVWAAGNVQFSSGRSEKFYKLLLRSNVPVPEHLPAIEYSKRLEGLEAGGGAIQVDLTCPVAPLPGAPVIAVAVPPPPEAPEGPAAPAAHMVAPAIAG